MKFKETKEWPIYKETMETCEFIKSFDDFGLSDIRKLFPFIKAYDSDISYLIDTFGVKKFSLCGYGQEGVILDLKNDKGNSLYVMKALYNQEKRNTELDNHVFFLGLLYDTYSRNSYTHIDYVRIPQIHSLITNNTNVIVMDKIGQDSPSNTLGRYLVEHFFSPLFTDGSQWNDIYNFSSTLHAKPILKVLYNKIIPMVEAGKYPIESVLSEQYQGDDMVSIMKELLNWTGWKPQDREVIRDLFISEGGEKMLSGFETFLLESKNSGKIHSDLHIDNIIISPNNDTEKFLGVIDFGKTKSFNSKQ